MACADRAPGHRQGPYILAPGPGSGGVTDHHAARPTRGPHHCREVPRKDDTTATFSLRLERAILKAARNGDFFKKGRGVRAAASANPLLGGALHRALRLDDVAFSKDLIEKAGVAGMPMGGFYSEDQTEEEVAARRSRVRFAGCKSRAAVETAASRVRERYKL